MTFKEWWKENGNAYVDKACRYDYCPEDMVGDGWELRQAEIDGLKERLAQLIKDWEYEFGPIDDPMTGESLPQILSANENVEFHSCGIDTHQISNAGIITIPITGIYLCPFGEIAFAAGDRLECVNAHLIINGFKTQRTLTYWPMNITLIRKVQ